MNIRSCLTFALQGPLLAYGHSAIREFIHVMVFSEQASRRPLAMRDLDAFNPIPIPLIALVVTAVGTPSSDCHVTNVFCQLLHGLEEYKTGTHETINFSGASYEDFYKKAVRNLRAIESSKILGPDLQRVRRHIFKTGR